MVIVVTAIGITAPIRVRVIPGGCAVTPARGRPARVIAVVRVRPTAVVIASAGPIIIIVISCAAVVTGPSVLAARVRAGPAETAPVIVAGADRSVSPVSFAESFGLTSISSSAWPLLATTPTPLQPSNLRKLNLCFSCFSSCCDFPLRFVARRDRGCVAT